MPPTGRWILILAGLVSVAIALQATVLYPLSTKNPVIILLYEIGLFMGMFLVMGLVYREGYTRPDLPTV